MNQSGGAQTSNQIPIKIAVDKLENPLETHAISQAIDENLRHMYMLGVLFTDNERKSLLYEMLSLSGVKSAEEVLNIIRTATSQNRKIQISEFYTSSVYDPQKQRYIAEVARQRDPIEQEKSDDKCPKCGEQNVSFTRRQMRAADEPMTTCFVCGDCGANWNIG